MEIYKIRKKIAIFFFIVALIYAIPPFIFESFTDIFVNLPTALFISSKFGFKLLTSLLLTYTLVPILLLYIGSVIYPADTTRVFNGQFTKIKNFFIGYIHLIKRNPIHLIWALLSLIIMLKLLGFYSTQINIYLLS